MLRNVGRFHLWSVLLVLLTRDKDSSAICAPSQLTGETRLWEASQPIRYCRFITYHDLANNSLMKDPARRM